METTYEEAEKLLNESIKKIPEINALVSQPDFQRRLENILRNEKIDVSFLPQIEWELRCVLGRYAPIDEFAENISESTGIPLGTCTNLTSVIEALLLNEVTDNLYAFALHWHQTLENAALVPDANSNLKEKLELRPEGVPRPVEVPTPPSSSQPLTREALLNTLAPKRTMATDIAEIKEKKEEPHQGYEAFVAAKEAHK